MKFDDLQAIELLKKNAKVQECITKARVYDKKLNALVNGHEVKDLLIHIEHIEDSKKAIARKRYARGIRDLNDKILRPIDNIYSATGGSKQYNINGEDKTKTFLAAISNVRDNKSIESWLKTYWIKPLLHGQPNGLIFMEWKDTKCYPTFKSINSIRHYETKGQNVEYVIFEPELKTIKEFNDYYKVTIPGVSSQKVEMWRIVDDAWDRRYFKANDIFTPIAELTFINPFKQCPGIINSELFDFNCDHRISPIHSIVETEEEYLRDQSVKTIYKFKHGFPTFWRYAIICNTCKGRKKVGDKVCADCDGKGAYLSKDVTDEAIIPIPQSSDQVKIAPDIAGFVAPDLNTWKQYSDELKLLRDEMYETHWGSTFVQEQNQTATGKFIDIQPVKNRLNDYADKAQWVEWQLTEWVANFTDPTKSVNNTVSTIIYGRNYLIEAPDEILTRYEDAKTKNSPTTILDRLFLEYITTKFKNDPENLRLNLIKFELEPFPHYDVETVKSIFGAVAAQKKMLFSDFWEDLDFKVIESSKAEELEKLFDDYMLVELGEQVKEKVLLADKIGVGGTQALQSILVDPIMSPESKRATIEILFNLSPEDSARMVSDKLNQNVTV